MSASATMLLIRPRGLSACLTRLQLLASAVTTILAFTVMMLALALWNVPTDEAGYTILAVALAGLLLVPLATLGSAAARLAVRSRDDRLATLRLLGATSGRVRRIAVAEVTVLSGIGVLLGTAFSTGLPFLLSLLSVYGQPLDSADLRPPWWMAVSLPPALVAGTAVSGTIGLRRVALTPLGVRTRQEAPDLSRLRVLAAAVVLGSAVLVMQSASDGWGPVVVIVVLATAVLAVMGVLGLVGPFVVSRLARSRAARTSDPAQLIAARGVVDDPRTAWRAVSTLALTTFAVIPTASMLGYLDTIQRSESREIMTADTLQLIADARTMMVALVVVSFTLVACQVAITQTAAVIERRELHVALHRIGMPTAELHRARRLRVTMPVSVAVIGSALTVIVLAFWAVLMALLTAPLYIVAIALVLAGGVGLVRLGVAATAPVLRRVLDSPGRGGW